MWTDRRSDMHAQGKQASDSAVLSELKVGKKLMLIGTVEKDMLVEARAPSTWGPPPSASPTGTVIAGG